MNYPIPNSHELKSIETFTVQPNVENYANIPVQTKQIKGKFINDLGEVSRISEMPKLEPNLVLCISYHLTYKFDEQLSPL